MPRIARIAFAGIPHHSIVVCNQCLTRTPEQSGQFKRDLKREAKGPHRVTLAKHFISIVEALAKDEPLAGKHRDHALTGDWKARVLGLPPLARQRPVFEHVRSHIEPHLGR